MKCVSGLCDHILPLKDTSIGVRVICKVMGLTESSTTTTRRLNLQRAQPAGQVPEKKATQALQQRHGTSTAAGSQLATGTPSAAKKASQALTARVHEEKHGPHHNARRKHQERRVSARHNWMLLFRVGARIEGEIVGNNG